MAVNGITVVFRCDPPPPNPERAQRSKRALETELAVARKRLADAKVEAETGSKKNNTSLNIVAERYHRIYHWLCARFAAEMKQQIAQRIVAASNEMERVNLSNAARIRLYESVIAEGDHMMAVVGAAPLSGATMAAMDATTADLKIGVRKLYSFAQPAPRPGVAYDDASLDATELRQSVAQNACMLLRSVDKRVDSKFPQY